MAATQRLALPLLAVGQAQKEVTHNEALLAIDGLLQGVCEGPPGDTPPSAPGVGSVFLCGLAPTGVWSGNAQAIATFSPFGWRFVAALDGMRLADRSGAGDWTFHAGEWRLGKLHGTELFVDGVKVVGSQRPAIAAASGGSVQDAEARTAIAGILAALRAHGLIAT